ncbi:MAG: flagellar hook-associated protein FlgK [Alphaproteobacteria bacterium]
MTLTTILSTAITGLNAAQRALQTTSVNVANVNTPGYARKEVQFQTAVVGGMSAGVELADVRRLVDTFLQNELVIASGSAGFYEAQNGIYERLQDLFGEPGSPSALTARLNEALSSFSALVLEPSSTPSRIASLNDLQELANDISRVATSVQTLRSEADRRIMADLETLNSALEQIHQLNPVIAQQLVSGIDVSALQERRDQALERIADIIDVRTSTMSDGRIGVFTTAGLTLLDSNLRVFEYVPNGVVDTTSRFNQVQVWKKDAGTGQLTATGENFEAALRGGSIKGLLEMRDKELPELSYELGELAARLVDEVNRVHNGNTAVPPPNSLFGRNTGALGTDPHGFTGEVAFGVLDANNEIVQTVTIDFANPALVTLDDVIAAVNTGLAGAGTLDLTAGVMSFSAASGSDGVAMLNNPINASDRAGRGFAHFFGLNDLMTARVPPHFDTGLTSAASHGFGSSGTANLELRGPGAQVAASFTLDFSAVGGTVGDVVTALNTGFAGVATWSLDGNGALTATPAAGFENYVVHTRTDTTDRGGSGVTFSDFFGPAGSDQADAAFSMNVDSAFLTDPAAMALAKYNPSTASGDPAVTIGDNRGALGFDGLLSNAFAFDTAGDIAGFTTTLADYAGAILSSQALEADRASSLMEDRSVLRDELRSRRDAATGVNLDEELANLIVFQNAYNAAARIITTANQMFETLIDIA